MARSKKTAQKANSSNIADAAAAKKATSVKADKPKRSSKRKAADKASDKPAKGKGKGKGKPSTEGKVLGDGPSLPGGPTIGGAEIRAGYADNGMVVLDANKPASLNAHQEAVGASGIWRRTDTPWHVKKAHIYGALLDLGATSVSKAQGTASVATAASKRYMAAGGQRQITEVNVRHFCYHGSASGRILCVDNPGSAQKHFVLTDQGKQALEANVAHA